MSRVQIGVPVFNGGPLLKQSLECLRTQSFEDIEVVIGDNASDDETADTCAEFVARDPRFRHIRRPSNIGPVANFLDLADTASAPLFCWRAHDDLSAPDYVEKLVALFDRHPDLQLAVSDIRTVRDDRKVDLARRWSQPPASPQIARLAHQMRNSHASWIYGLWHRETLTGLLERVHSSYSAAWGWDYLVLLAVVLDGRVAGTPETEFIQQIFRAHTTRSERLAKQPTLAEWRDMRREFSALANEFVGERPFTSVERLALWPLTEGYVNRCCVGRFQLWRRALRRWIARSGDGTAS